MKRVSEVLQLAVVIKGSRPSFFELQPLQKLDFLFGGIAAEGSILEEPLQTRLHLEGLFRFPFDELESLYGRKGQPAVQDDFHAKSPEVNVPGLDQRIEEGDPVLNRDVVHIGPQKLEDRDPHPFIGPAAETSHQAEPDFA